MLHGTGSQWQVWRPLFERLAPHRELIAVDLPGFGESPPLTGRAATPYALADAVAGFLDSAGVERPAVLGNSLGGWIGLELAKRGRASAVTALSPAGFWTPRERAFCIATLRFDAAASRALLPVAPIALRNPLPRTALLWSMIGRPWQVPPDAAFEMMENHARSPGLEATLDGYARETFRGGDEVEVPVTIAWGTRDRLLLPRQAPRAVRVVRKPRLEWLHGAGHVPTWDDPDAIARLALATG